MEKGNWNFLANAWRTRRSCEDKKTKAPLSWLPWCRLDKLKKRERQWHKPNPLPPLSPNPQRPSPHCQAPALASKPCRLLCRRCKRRKVGGCEVIPTTLEANTSSPTATSSKHLNIRGCWKGREPGLSVLMRPLYARSPLSPQDGVTRVTLIRLYTASSVINKFSFLP